MAETLDYYHQIVVELVDELMLSSGLTPELTRLFRDELLHLYLDGLLEASDSYTVVSEHLYSLKDNNLYIIAGYSTPADDYLYYMFTRDFEMPHGALKKTLITFKETHPDVLGEQIGEIAREVSDLYRVVCEAANIAKRSIRKASDNKKPEPDLPSKEELEYFYKCGRKKKFFTEAEAEENLQGEEHVYKCEFGEHYHKGHPPVWVEIPEEIQYGRWVTFYRRMHKI